jgi:serine/threonine-protein kinase
MAVGSGGPFAVGTVIDDRYRILGQLGKGGMGGVYLANQIKFDREIALKVLVNTAMADPVARKRFINEAKAVCGLQHPNIVVYHDFGTDSDTDCLFLVMERLKGRSLAQVLNSEGMLSIHRVIHIMIQLCDALSEAHAADMVHRDLKPGNVMLVRRGDDPDFVKLIDFGIAKAAHTDSQSPKLTQMGMIIGTTGYLAPEYITKQVVDLRIDIYALGVMCYELISGRRPFTEKDQIALMQMHINVEPPPLSKLEDGHVVPPSLNAVVLRAMAKDPEQRFQSTAEFKTALIDAAKDLMDPEASADTIQMEALSVDSEIPTIQMDLSKLDLSDAREEQDATTTTTQKANVAEASSSTDSLNDAAPTVMAEASSSTDSLNDAAPTVMAEASTSTDSLNDAAPTVMAEASTSTDSLDDAAPTVMAEVPDSLKKAQEEEEEAPLTTTPQQPHRTDTGLNTSLSGNPWFQKFLPVAASVCVVLVLTLVLWPSPEPRPILTGGGTGPDIDPSTGSDGGGEIILEDDEQWRRILENPVDYRSEDKETRRPSAHSAAKGKAPQAEQPLQMVLVTVAARPGGNIYKGNRLLGSLQISIRLREGRHCFKAVNPHLGTKRRCIRARAGVRNRLVINLNR